MRKNRLLDSQITINLRDLIDNTTSPLENIGFLNAPNPNKVTLPIFLPEGFMAPIPLRYEEIYSESVIESGKGLKKGKIYHLYGHECDDFEPVKRTYECKGVIKEHDGIALNSVLMKQIEGEECTSFTLTRLDCIHLGIDYEPGLQLFPYAFNWIPIESVENIPFTDMDLGTYEGCPIDGTIKQMHIIIKNVTLHPSDVNCIITPLGEKVTINHFINTLQFKFKDETLNRRFPIHWALIKEDADSNSIVDVKKSCIHIMLFFVAPTLQKDVIGLKRDIVEGKSIDDMIQCYWQSFYANKRVELENNFGNAWNGMQWNSTFRYIRVPGKPRQSTRTTL